MRVLHLINGEHYSGAERVQDLLAARLFELGIRVGFAALRPGRFPHERQFQSAPLQCFPMRGRLDVTVAWRLRRWALDEGYQLLHAHTPRSALIAHWVARITKLPWVYHVHSPAAADSTHRWRNRLNGFLEHICLRGASRLITVSHSLRQHMFQRGYPGSRLVCVPNGVPASARLADRAPPNGTWRLGTVALFRPRKGTEVLIDAVSILHQQNVKIALTAVGPFESADYEAALRAQVDRLQLNDIIHWTGFTPDVPRMLRDMDIFVMPSLFGEGLPMVVLEAMAAGVPVVGTQVEGIPEAVRHGIDGVIVPPADPAAMASGIEAIIDGRYLWSDLRTSAFDRQVELFSDRSMAAGVAQIYREILHLHPDQGVRLGRREGASKP